MCLRHDNSQRAVSLANLMAVTHYSDGQAHTCPQQAASSVANIRISGTLPGVFRKDVNRIVIQLLEHYTWLWFNSSFFPPIFSLKCSYGVIFLLLTDVQRIICRAHCRMKEALCGSVCWGWIWISQQFRELIVVCDCSWGACACVCACVSVCTVSRLSSLWHRVCVCLSYCHPEVNMKDSGLNGTSPGLWNILSGLYGNTARTHTLKQTLTLRHVACTSTKGARGEKLIYTHTDEVKTAIYTWWVFDHQLSSISRCLSLCLSSSPSSSSGCSEVFSRASISPDI